MPVKSAAGEDIQFMRAALAEASKGLGLTRPNPAVGALIVRGRKIVSRGWHRKAGSPHAEVEAISALKDSATARGATLYVTLEPCSTTGRTPPCTDAIIRAGITRVVYGARDPNPLHAGRADRVLRRAGVSVVSGVLPEECAALNEAWNKWISTGLPFVTAKAGMTLDGRIGSPPGRRWITSAASRRDAMALRASSDAVLVGGGTIRADNPRLTIRGLPAQEQPLRVVWSKTGHLPAGSRIFTDRHRSRTIVFQGRPLRDVLIELGRRGVQSVLIEGGGRTLGEALDRDLIDRFVIYVAPFLTGGDIPAIGGKGALTNAGGRRLQGATFRMVGGDLRIEGRIGKASS